MTDKTNYNAMNDALEKIGGASALVTSLSVFIGEAAENGGNEIATSPRLLAQALDGIRLVLDGATADLLRLDLQAVNPPQPPHN